MKQLSKFSAIILIAFFFAGNGFAQNDSKPPAAAEVVPGAKPVVKMEKYWFVLLKTGPKQNFDSATKAQLFEGHMANINKLYEDGILKVAGPFGKNELAWRGIFVFDCETKEAAEKIAATDPAIAAGLFAVDIVPWFSEAVGSFKHGKPEKQ